MVGDILRGTRRVPDFRSTMRGGAGRLSRLTPSPKALVVGGTLGCAAVALTAAGYMGYDRHKSEVRAAGSPVEVANLQLQDELARLRDQVAASSRDLAAAQSRVNSLAEELQARPQPAPAAAPAAEEPKGERLSQMSKSLHLAEAQRATMAARLSKAETDLADWQAKQAQIQSTLDQLQKQIQQLSAERDRNAAERDRLRAKVGELEQKLSLKRAGNSAVAQAAPAAGTPSAAAAPSVATAQPPQQRMAAVVNPATGAAVVETPRPAAPAAAVAVAPSALGQVQRVLASAGVDVRRMFAELDARRNEGGPFVPAPRGAQPATLSPEKVAALRAIIKTVPVGAPLADYEVSSPFGVRGDPENGHAAFHTGLDMTAPYDTPVYATAPGVVTFAGYRDDYGRIVEIDHGNGIATRYAHLHQAAVSVGQRVAAHQQIGYLGSSGRATGPHVHYEVVVNGEPQNPEKFVDLARYVPAIIPVAARR